MKHLKDAKKQIFRTEPPQPGGSDGTSISGCGVLPPEMINQAVRRLGWAALFYAVSLPVSRLGISYDIIKVLDFGLVKSSAPSETTESQVTIAGITTGTPAYMAPEIALGKRGVDVRADIYSLGCVAYWLITGQLVFDETGGSLPVLLAHVQTPPVPPSQRTELHVPVQLEKVILSCLEKDPNRRPQTIADLVERLSSISLENAWNSQRAEEWWRNHMPSMALHPVRELQVAGSQ